MAYLAGTNRSVDTGDTYFNELSKRINRNQLKKLKTDGTVEARIEYARYIVDCPNCNSAEFAFEDNLFFCSQCKNSDIQGKAREVKMPKGRKQIEDILGKRVIANRHWLSTESVKDLQNENLKMGVI
jgi:endogenous inhibitor of DNA gyrase (YacG/DUF329 family)